MTKRRNLLRAPDGERTLMRRYRRWRALVAEQRRTRQGKPEGWR